jgi:hypothetical protein
MKVKNIVALTLAMCAFGSESKAQATIQFLGGGSSSMFLELGQAAVIGAGAGACVWTSNIAYALDNRPIIGSPATQPGRIWVVWSPGSGACSAPTGSFNIWSYMSLDSTVGNRCYFEVDSTGAPGCVQILNAQPGAAGANLLCYPSKTTCAQFGDTAGGLPGNVSSAVNGQHWFAAGTDILPADAKFATYRLLQPCGVYLDRQPSEQDLRRVQALGYGTQDVLSYYGDRSYYLSVRDFNISGNDPVNTTLAVPAYTILPIGVQPVLVAVGPNDTTGTGLNLATDIPAYVLMSFYNGSLGRATDLIGPIQPSAVTTLVREPLSGTYNVFEWSTVNNSQFHDSQDAYNCAPGTDFLVTQPMNLLSLHGQPANAAGQFSYRRRVISTDEMVAQLQNATDTDNRLGYFFWSAGNAAGLTNVKYLTVNGVDPLQDSYTNGTLPGSRGPGDPGLSAVTFKNLNNGDYPIWSVLRIITRPPYVTAANNLISALQTLNTTQNNFITLANLKIWHSHYSLPAIGISNSVVANGSTINPATPNDLCNTPGALPEGGGDAGGATMFKVANNHFCQDFAVTSGLVNKTN